jgi:hypothetical protein
MTHTYDDFFHDVLKGLDITPIPGTVGTAARRALAVVSIIEGANTRWNPLNITRPPGSGGDYNSAHVQIYGSYGEGVGATVTYFRDDRLKWIRMALAYSTVRSLMLRQYELYYAGWKSFPDFQSITTERADQRLAMVMKGPGA